MVDNLTPTEAVMKDTVARMTKIAEQEKARKAKIVDNIEQFKTQINLMFSTEAGKLFALVWLRSMGIFSDEEGKDGVGLFESRGAKRFYLTYIRPNLTITVRQQIEGQL